MTPTQLCESVWRSLKPLVYTPTPQEVRYRQHRCGVVGPHWTHVCRYCGAER